MRANLIYSFLLSTADPPHALSIFPLAILFLARARYVGSLTVLLSVRPLASVAPLVGPDKLTVAFLLVFAVLTYVLATVSPSEGSLAVHFVCSPFAFVLPVIGPGVDTLAVDIIVIELAYVLGAIRPLEGTHAMLLSKLVTTFVLCIIWPGLDSVAVLPIFFPFTDVLGSVHVLVCASAFSLVVDPLTLVDVAVSVNEPASAIGLVLLPVAFVLAAVSPVLDSLALSVAGVLGPLSFVDGLVVELEVLVLVDQILVVLVLLLVHVVVKVAQSFLHLLRDLVVEIGQLGQLPGPRVPSEQHLALIHLRSRTLLPAPHVGEVVGAFHH